MYIRRTILPLLLASLMSTASTTWTQTLELDFSEDNLPLSTVGRGQAFVANGVLSAEGQYAVFGDDNLKDYSLSFRARTPEDVDQVQIWAGFRTANRFDRYVVGIKGDLQDDVYLMRTGYMGTDEFMGVRPLGFHPEPGEWIDVKVEVVGQRIRVFVNNMDLPYMDVVDRNGSRFAPNGAVALGGGWLKTEFDNVKIEALPETALDGVSNHEISFLPTPQEKETLRQAQRKAYTPKNLPLWVVMFEQNCPLMVTGCLCPIIR